MPSNRETTLCNLANTEGGREEGREGGREGGVTEVKAVAVFTEPLACLIIFVQGCSINIKMQWSRYIHLFVLSNK